MLKTVVIEDKFYTRKGLINIIKSLDKDISIVGECENVKDAIITTRKTKPDLILLDVNLPDGDAFDFLEETNDITYDVIFITSFHNFAIKAIKKDAVDYILKPVNIEELDNALDKVLHRRAQKAQLNSQHTSSTSSQKKDKLILFFNEGMQIVLFKELMFCKSENGYTTFYLENGKTFLTSKPIKDFEHQLSTDIFIRTHQSYVVNINFVDKYLKEGTCILKNGQKIPISTRRKKQFISKFI